jgi:hypothetical protein
MGLRVCGDLIQTNLLPQSRMDQPEVIIVHRICMKPWKVLTLWHQVVAPVLSQHQVLHDLEVGFVGFIINACARA